MDNPLSGIKLGTRQVVGFGRVLQCHQVNKAGGQSKIDSSGRFVAISLTSGRPNRGQFYHFIPAPLSEISEPDTVHENAQYPNQYMLRPFEDDADNSASAFGLAATGSMDYGWNSFKTLLRK